MTVGMAVDTNVLIFERIRDKMKEGRSFASSIDRGFDSAFSSIFDANVTTMIVAVALYTIGNGPIQELPCLIQSRGSQYALYLTLIEIIGPQNVVT